MISNLKKFLPRFLPIFLFVITVFFALSAPNAFALTITPIRFELKANPGQTIKQEITLFNEHETEEILYVSYANFEASGDSGNPTFVEPKDGLGTWMNAAEKVTIAPKSSQIVPLVITVPHDATPGGHFAVAFWGTVPPKSTSNQVSIGSKTGVLVLLSVSGAVSEDGGIIEFDTKDKKNFYTSLPVSFFYKFQNNGGDRVKPTGNIIIKNMIGITASKVQGNPVDGNVLPNSTRKIETVWQGKDGDTPIDDVDQGNFFTKAGREWRNFAFGYYKANLSLSYGTKNQVTMASVGIWVFPWHLLILILIVGCIAYIALRKGISHYNNWVISRAEDMLRREHVRRSKKQQ